MKSKVLLNPGQFVLSSVAYDGKEPRDFEYDPVLRQIARDLFGDIDVVPDEARDVIVVVAGARAGKTYVLISARLVYGMLTRDLSPLAPNERAFALVIAPNDELRQQAINYGIGILQSGPWADWLVLPKNTKPDDTPTWFGVRRPSGKYVRFRGAVAARGGYGGRGKSCVDAALDESAFFHGSEYKVSDVEIFKAVTARIMPGGQVVVGSTPWAKEGLLWDEFDANFGKPSTALAAHAPTVLLNPLPWAKRIVEREYKRDPENAAREFGAQFMASGGTVCFDPDLLMAAVDSEMYEPQAGDILRAGMDLGFTRDSAALVIVAVAANVIRPVFVMELKPEPGQPLMPGATIRAFAKELQKREIPYAMGDGHYKQSAIEHFDEHKLGFIDAPTQPADAFMFVKGMLRDHRLRVPNDERLIKQAKQVRAVPRTGGGMSIIQPRWSTGGHGDLCSAWVLACFQVGGTVVRTDEPEDPETEMQRVRAAMRKERQNPSPIKRWYG